jgi:hypothetical protein
VKTLLHQLPKTTARVAERGNRGRRHDGRMGPVAVHSIPQMSAVLTGGGTTGHGKPVTRSKAEHFASLARATCRPPATANRATADTSSHTLALSVRAGRDSCAMHRCRCAHETNSMFGAPKRKQIFAGYVTYVWSPWKLVECDLARKEVTGACVGVRRRQGSPCREESGRQDLAGPHDQKKGHRKFQL